MSSEQLAAPERGFPFCRKVLLICEWIRSDKVKPLHRSQQRSEFEIRRLLQIYGEERFAPQIARAIVKHRAILHSSQPEI